MKIVALPGHDAELVAGETIDGRAASSAAGTGSVEFTIKAVGDFTRAATDAPAGAKAYLDGPYGAFSIDREQLDSLAQRRGLRIVHVLGEPPERWEGERGQFTAALLERHLPPRRAALFHLRSDGDDAVR